MKFFTEDVVNGMNTGQLADQAWDGVCANYETHVQGLIEKLPSTCKAFVENTSLCESVVLCEPKISKDKLFLAMHVRSQEDYICHCCYDVDGEMDVRRHEGPGFDKSSDPLWLYDEWDVDENGKFVHRVLFNTGLEIMVPFKEFHWTLAKVVEDY